MIPAIKIFRYLRFKNCFVSGLRLNKSLKVPFSQIPELLNYNGIGGFGPAGDRIRNKRDAVRYSKCNAFDADFIGLFRSGNRIYCFKQKTLRKGKYHPRKVRLK